MDKKLTWEIINYLEDRLKAKKVEYTFLFKDLKRKFRGLDFALLCNYILENKIDILLLNQTIREINSLKYIQNFDSLLNFIQSDADVNTRVLAIKTIAGYKNKKAVSVLLRCLNDSDSNYKIRFACAEALGKIGDKTAFEALGFIVSNDNEKSSYVKESAVVALGNLGDKRAIEVFSSIMSSNQMFLDKFSCLKERIIEAISKLDISKDSNALDILKQSLSESSPRVRISAIEAIMNINSSESYELIYEKLKTDTDLEVRKNALVALYNISDRKILDEVLQGEFEEELKCYARDLILEYEEDYE